MKTGVQISAIELLSNFVVEKSKQRSVLTSALTTLRSAVKLQQNIEFSFYHHMTSDMRSKLKTYLDKEIEELRNHTYSLREENGILSLVKVERKKRLF